MTNALQNFLTEQGVTKSLVHASEESANTTAVIVALPSELDSIRLVGDEDKHATMLFFGETASLPEDAKEKIIEVLTLAASMYYPFRDRVIGVERLGSDNPPALVAKLRGQMLSTMRNTMLIVPEFNQYLGNATQYPSYTPHVTLGYPGFPEEVLLRAKANNVELVGFDRLALWWGDEHFEFPLQVAEQGDFESEVAHNALAFGTFMSHYAQAPDDVVTGFLEKAGIRQPIQHFGVKGMKWGVRRDNPSGGLVGRLQARKQSKEAAAIAKAAPAGAVGHATRADGTPIYVKKKTDGTWEETYLSKDAESFMKTHMKSQHEMSDQELRSYLNRAKMMKEYDELAILNPKRQDPNQELADTVKRLQLQRDMAQVKAQLRGPSAAKRVSNFVKNVNPAFQVFKQLDDMTGRTMSKQMTKSLQAAFDKSRDTTDNARDVAPKKPKKQKKAATFDSSVVVVDAAPDSPTTQLPGG